MVINACFMNLFFWELLSILTLTFFGLFWFIERVAAHKHYVMLKLISLLVLLAATFVIWVKLAAHVPAQRLDGVVDLILLAAMACITIHFVLLLLRASRIPIPHFVERSGIVLALIATLVYGIYLFTMGTAAQFAALDTTVNMLLRSFWVIVTLTLIARVVVH